MCTWVATYVILGRMEHIVKCQSMIGGLEDGKSEVHILKLFSSIGVYCSKDVVENELKGDCF